MSTYLPPSRSTSTGRPLIVAERPPKLFILTRRAEPRGSIRLILAGEFDLAALLHLQSALDAAQDDADRVLLDLGALTLIDCSGLGTIFAAAKRAREDGTVLMLVEPRGQVRRLLDLVGMPPGVGVLDQADTPSRVRPVAA